MDNHLNLKQATTAIYKKITSLDFERLDISDYNKQYIRRLIPVLHYYLDIYAYCIKEGLHKCNKALEELILIDYGGGSGFLSMMAKQVGIGTVIYIDLNENSVETIRILKKKTGIGPDIILQGDSRTLSEWCLSKQINPDLLISTDVIEHIYNLSDFFSDLTLINDQLKMIFTTASNPYNPFVTYRLRRFMRGCETGNIEKPNYYTKRLLYIQKTFPQMSDTTLKKWSKQTRGLIYEDIYQAITNNEYPTQPDRFNTCDPETGNWAERILPIQKYKEIAQPFHLSVSLQKGFYNTRRTKKWKSVVLIVLNRIINHSGKTGFFLSPFILLSFGRK
jgi:2-polyprenyl-3-methyl-5-hydroxy-6-metoxy-1,4-benzoquinol methylase